MNIWGLIRLRKRLWLLLATVVVGCAGIPQSNVDIQQRPVERIDVSAQFEPRVDREEIGQHGINFMGMIPMSIGCGPLVVVCLPLAMVVGTVATAASVTISYATKSLGQPSGSVNKVDPSGRGNALLQSRLEAILTDAGWQVRDAGSGRSPRTLRLEARVERLKTHDRVPTGDRWVLAATDVDLSWRLVDPSDSTATGTVTSGSFRLDRRYVVLPLRLDEASRRWVCEDRDGLDADWERVAGEIAGRIAERALPALTAYAQNGQR